jgi:hypothetical protein
VNAPQDSMLKPATNNDLLLESDLSKALGGGWENSCEVGTGANTRRSLLHLC